MGEKAGRGPVDFDQLNRQTGGDDALAREVLNLFLAHAPLDMARLTAARDSERSAFAHRLVGSARGVGAARVARLAASVEAGAEGDIPALEDALAEAVGFIKAHLGGATG
jgi:HPt (histidine-containing phosphotransfer) domain-containing protein